jgi:hypothetical protein
MTSRTKTNSIIKISIITRTSGPRNGPKIPGQAAQTAESTAHTASTRIMANSTHSAPIIKQTLITRTRITPRNSPPSRTGLAIRGRGQAGGAGVVADRAEGDGVVEVAGVARAGLGGGRWEGAVGGGGAGLAGGGAGGGAGCAGVVAGDAEGDGVVEVAGVARAGV